MKKLMSLFLGLVFVMSLVSVAWADEGISDQKYAKVENQVEKANEKISDLVSKAVAEAEKKINHYTEKVLEIEVDKEFLGGELSQLSFEIGSLDGESKNYDKIHKEIEKMYDKINNNEKMEKMIQQLEDDLDKIVAQLIQHTNNIAYQTIEDGAKEGIVVECELVEVMIGDETVLIDPLRIRRY